MKSFDDSNHDEKYYAGDEGVGSHSETGNVYCVY